MAFQNYYDILPIDKEEEEEIKSVVIDEENVSERLQALEVIIRQQQQELELLRNKNNMLEKIVADMKNKTKKQDKTNEIKVKTEEDFVKEVAEIKFANIILANQLEIADKETKILKETLQQLTEKKKRYVVKIHEKKDKNENKKEQDLIQETYG